MEKTDISHCSWLLPWSGSSCNFKLSDWYVKIEWQANIHITNIWKCTADIDSSCLRHRSDEEYDNLIKCKILDQTQADCFKTNHHIA